MLIDISNLSEEDTDNALENIYKALGDGDQDSLWDHHPSPFIRRLIELFTQRGLVRMDALRQEWLAWMEGRRHTGSPPPQQRPGMMRMWSPEEMQLVNLYLSALPSSAFTLDDHMMLVDYLVQRYLPADSLRTEAEWLTTRSALMGRVQANMATVTVAQADTIIGAMPLTVASARTRFRLNPRQLAVLNFSASRAADRVQKVSDDTRYRMRTLIRRHTEGLTLKDSVFSGRALQSKLVEDFGTLNRDWRRIAVTEAGEALNQGLVSSLKPGARLKRIEQYRGACAFCRKIDGREVTVVAPHQAIKDPDSNIWVGKDNYGRSASPNKRVGSSLIERTPDERWWVPAGTAHPNCRGRWVPVHRPKPGDDPEFAAWLKQTLGGKK